MFRKKIRHFLSILRYPKAFLLFKSYGSFVQLGPNGVFARPKEITLGTNVFINRNFHISANNLVIGDNILIGPNLLIETENHNFCKIGITMWEARKIKESGFLKIENDVWIGGNVIILKSVVIHEGCVIGAGSVVTKSLPPYSISVGNPCKPIKKRFIDDDLRNHLVLIKSKYSFEDVQTLWENYKFK